MTDICLIFEVHQPLRLNRNFLLDLIMRRKVTKDDLLELYFDRNMNREIFSRIADRCYLPSNEVILDQIDRTKKGSKRFKVTYSLSGVFIEQCIRWRPNLLDSFRHLADSGSVEFLDQTYYHSLSSLYNPDWDEFIDQVRMHRHLMMDLFGYEPRVFENTECIYNNAIAKVTEGLGYDAIITEGLDRVLGWRTPNYVYKAKGSSIRVLLRNYRLSDDVGFRFTSHEWDQWPLTADKYATWLALTPGQVVNIFMDYETFGEHYRTESGILEFLRWLPEEVEKWDHLFWRTPCEVIDSHVPVDEIDIPVEETISWADEERDVSAWLGNQLQLVSFNLQREIGLLARDIEDEKLLELWRYLQTSDHLYYMSMKGGGPGTVHSTFNPYGSPVEAFMAYARVISDLQARYQLELEKPEFRYKRILRHLPAGKGFTFFSGFASPTPFTAHSLEEFYSTLKNVPADSIQFHMDRRDFQRWFDVVIGDGELAKRLTDVSEERLEGEALRERILEIIKERIDELKRLSSGKDCALN